MRNRVLLILAACAVLISCGGESKPSRAKPASQSEPPKPADESRRFPRANLVKTEVVSQHLLGKSFMPGGTLAHYRRGKIEYEMFVSKLPTAMDAAVILPDWRSALANAKVEANFGGYSGEDAGRPVFVFAKGQWIAGVAGLPEKEADRQARSLAASLY